ncbi:E3 ubiquitin-protein ligase RNF4 [Strongylocentrotus purpuratus]|uniref:RING-type domain-containing protein n=1 Tax=Strongylocentrotus purpuratus TaxID=7668 RepID=A0A7M7GP35_STRPU|nr:E3 ubiquitin-protein ligase RNF4 [Strongylocentrotus purpuratus]
MDRTQPLSRKRRHSSRMGASTSHDEDEHPPRSRLRASRLTSRTSSGSVEIVDITPQTTTPPIAEDEPIDLSIPVCIVDLTDETETTRNRPRRNFSQDDIVDLTSVVDTPVEERAPRRRRRRSRRGRPMRSSQRGNIIPILSDDSDEENDIMVLPEIDIGQSYRTARAETPNSTATGPGRGRHATPQKRVITCPICMEDETTLRNNGQQLMSTNCGHVFCRHCIRASIQTQHRCPTCRKKLTMRQIHPIFL